MSFRLVESPFPLTWLAAQAILDIKAKDEIVMQRDAEIEELRKKMSKLQKELRYFLTCLWQDPHPLSGVCKSHM